jgi:4-aminobutyrate aminotransferase/4-aminobutyrate aminotransferase/(S)-3-amino-2-methylpropionate transaminase
MSQADTTPIGPEAILQKKKNYLVPCTYHFYKAPPQMVRGEGIFLFDSEGRRYMDLYCGVSVNALGHCNPELTEAICNQVRTLQHTTTIYLTEQIVNLAEALAGVYPRDLRKTFFCASGSEANEGAALLATLATGRSEFLAFQNGLHGRTKLGMSLTGLSFWRTDPNPVGGITFVPPPHCSKCPFGQKYGACKFECVQAVEKAILTSTSGKPAAMFVEPIQGNGGIVAPPHEYFKKLKSVLNSFGALLIADEVQTGFGRTGRMFAMEHWNVQADIITGGKALGAGSPIGYYATTDNLASAFTRPSASTFGGNPVTAAGAMAFLRILKRDNYVERAEKLGLVLEKRLKEIAAQQPVIQDVRGRGLMLGVEVGECGQWTPAEFTDAVLEKMKDRGYLLGKTGPGRNVLTFMPPFIIREDKLLEAADVFESVVLSVSQTPRSSHS